MKKLLLLGIGLSLLSSAAFASDLNQNQIVGKAVAPAPQFSWTGFYIGLNGGYGKGDGRTTQSATKFFGGVFPAVGSESQSGPQIGLQGGYRKQIAPNWVLGVEGDFDWLNRQRNSAASVAIGPIATQTNSSSGITWASTVRGVVGFVPSAMPNLMIFGTGGFAFGETGNQASTVATGCFIGCGSATDNAVRTGWTVGGGVEVAFAKNWSAKGEYRHTDLGSSTVSYRGSGPVFLAPVFTTNTKFVDDAVLFGINYKLTPYSN